MLLKILFFLKTFLVFLIVYGAFQVMARDEDLTEHKTTSTFRKNLELEKDVFSIMHKRYEQAHWMRFELQDGSEKAKKAFEKVSFDPQTNNFVYIRPTDKERIERVLDALIFHKILKQEEAQEIKSDLQQKKTLEEKKKLFDNHEFLKSISYSLCTQQSYYVEIETKKPFSNIQKQLKEKGFWAESDVFFVTDLTVVKKRIEMFLDVFVSNGLIQETTRHMIFERL